MSEKELWQRTREPFQRIATCQTRLALSATPGADFLLELDALSVPQHPSNDTDGDTLFDQAASVRVNAGLDGSGQTVAIIDTGVAYDHVSLGGGYGPGYRVVGGWDFAEQDGDPFDDAPGGFHGTSVAGVIAGNDGSFFGMAPQVDLVALRVFNDQGVGDLDWVESALQWVLQNRDQFRHPITTVNLSLGALIPEDLLSSVQAQLQDEFRQLRENGILVFAAAGNQFDPSHPSALSYPASDPNVTAVASTRQNGELSDFSQRADYVFAAPGERIRSPVPDHVFGWDGNANDYSTISGTSLASPQAAGASVLVRQALQNRGLEAPPDRVIDILRSTAETATDPATGLHYQRLNLQRAIDLIDATPQVDNGASAGRGLNSAAGIHALGRWELGEETLQGNQWYTVVPERSGILSFVLPESTTAGRQFQVADDRGGELWSGNVQASQQIDVPVRVGESIRFQISRGDPVPIRIVNLVSVFDQRVDVFGTMGNDRVTLDTRGNVELSINGANYRWPARSLTNIQVDLGPNQDRLEFIGTEQNEQIVMRPGLTEIAQQGRTLRIIDAETIQVNAEGGGDRAFLYGSANDDSLEMNPGRAVIQGTGYSHTLLGASRVIVDASQGGNDFATLFDSSGDDRLAIRHQFTSLVGDGYFLNATGFERVQAYAGAGGRDTAALYDSAGNDYLGAGPSQAWISGPGYYAQARGFAEVRGMATEGGHDTAHLYAGSVRDHWVRVGDELQLISPEGHRRAAAGFDQSLAFLGTNTIQVAPLAIESPRLVDDGAQEVLPIRLQQLLNASSRRQNRAIEGLISVRQDREKEVFEQILASLGDG